MNSILVDYSPFTLGVILQVKKDGEKVLYTKIEHSSELEDFVLKTADQYNINDVYIRPFDKKHGDRILKKYNNTLNKNFTSRVDSVKFHLV